MKKNSMSGIMVLLIFGIFAVCILAVLMAGATNYKDLTGTNEQSYNERTAAQYISTKLRQNDVAGAVCLIDAPSGGRAIGILEELDGDRYVTLIFCREGYLIENYFYYEDGAELDWEGGEKIIEAQSLDGIINESGLIHMILQLPDGKSCVIEHKLRSEVTL